MLGSGVAELFTVLGSDDVKLSTTVPGSGVAELFMVLGSDDVKFSTTVPGSGVAELLTVLGSDDVKLSTTVPGSGVAELLTMALGSDDARLSTMLLCSDVIEMASSVISAAMKSSSVKTDGSNGCRPDLRYPFTALPTVAAWEYAVEKISSTSCSVTIRPGCCLSQL